MARIRSLKPEFFLSEQVGSVSFGARLLFAGLWTIADKEGRLRWAPRKLKAQLFPYDDIELFQWAEELVDRKLVAFYEDEAGVYLFVPGFSEHQRPHPKEPASVLPEYPAGHDFAWLPWKKTASRVLPGSIPSSPVGREGKGMDIGREGGSNQPSAPAPVRIAPLIESPLAWDRKHGGHVGGFCDWVCLPGDLAEQFAGRAGWDQAQVVAWAEAVRRNWQASGRVPAGKMYDFWNDRWTEQHPATKPAKADWKAEVLRRAGEGR